jgi:outer membrane protein assembly factor BamB
VRSLLLIPIVFGAACGFSVPADRVDALSAMRWERPGLPALQLRWKFTVADHEQERKPQEFASAAVISGVGDDDRLFIGSQAGTFYALSATNGRVLWKAAVGSVSARPLVYLGRIYVGTDDGFLVCLDTLDGSEKWRYATRGPIMETPVIADGMLFFSNEADQVYALEIDTGAFRWQYKGETPEEYTLRGHAGVAVDNGLLFTGFSNGALVALRTSSGSVAWMTSLKGDADRFVDVDATPVVAGDVLYVTSSAGGVHAIDKVTGLVRWRTPMTNAGGLTVDGDRLYVAAAEEGIHALDLGGNIVWRQGTRGGGEPGDPLVMGGYLVYTLSEDGVYVADKRTGEVVQFFQPGDGVSATPTPWKDQLFIHSNGGILYAMNVEQFLAE